MRQLFAFFLCSFLSSAFALTCNNLDGAFKLELEGLGSIYFSDFNSNDSGSNYTLFNGICLLADDGWQVESSSILVVFDGDSFFVSAQDVLAMVFEWQLEAKQLELISDSLILHDLILTSRAISGEAQKATFDIPTGTITLDAPSAQTNAILVQGTSATLDGSTLVFQNAIATTCTCHEEALYLLSAAEARFDYETDRIFLSEGQLHIGNLSIDLNDLDLSQESFKSLTLPFSIEYITDNPSTDQSGTGLGLTIPSLAVDENFSLELGLLGLDFDYPLRGILIAHYRDDRVRFDVGHAALGPQADFELKETLTPWLSAIFDMRNRVWEDQDFLHDAGLSLQARQRFRLNDHVFTVSGEVLSAISSQQLQNDNVADVRLFVDGNLHYTGPKTAWGQLSSSIGTESTYYTLNDSSQYGVHFDSQWLHSLTNGTRFKLSYDLLLTNSASPFSTKLDKLEPKSKVSFSLSGNEAIVNNLDLNFRINARYDFLSAAPAWQQVDQLNTLFSLAWQRDNILITPSLEANLASLINPHLTNNAFFQASLTLNADTWEAGIATRLDAKTSEFTKVETSFSFPIEFGAFYLQPFLAVDILPGINDAALPRISGHGLEVIFDSCCGILNFSYRQVENRFTTSINVRFDE